jgi:hypothetical protein
MTYTPARRSKQIRDPIYSYITIDGEDMDIVYSSPFRRFEVHKAERLRISGLPFSHSHEVRAQSRYIPRSKAYVAKAQEQGTFRRLNVH